MEQSEIEPVPIWGAGTAGSCLTYYATAPNPRPSCSAFKNIFTGQNLLYSLSLLQIFTGRLTSNFPSLCKWFMIKMYRINAFSLSHWIYLDVVFFDFKEDFKDLTLNKRTKTYKRVNIVCFYIYEVLEQAKLRWKKSEQWLSRVDLGWRLRRLQGTLSRRNCAVSCVCQNHIANIYMFHAYKLYLKKKNCR